MRRTHSLIHRGYLYAQKRPMARSPNDDHAMNPAERTRLRMVVADAYKAGYLQSRRDAKKGR